LAPETLSYLQGSWDSQLGKASATAIELTVMLVNLQLLLLDIQVHF
jgi:hypothetical protein